MSSTKTSRGKKVLGVEVAPLHVPWERRMETLAVTFWANTLSLSLILLLVLVYLYLYTRLWPVPLMYAVYYILDRKTCFRGGRRQDWVRKLSLWKRYNNYFPITFVKTAELDPSRNYLVCSHPHGVICNGMFGCFGTEGRDFSKVFPGLTHHILTLDSVFMYPLYREWVLSYGGCSASRESMNYLLSRPERGHLSVLVPGGAPESLESHPGPDTRVHLKNKKGFVKVAIQNGVPIVPSFSFQENEIYDQMANPPGSKFRKFQDFFQKTIGFAPVVVFGRGILQYTFGMLPHRKPITVVVGAPIETEKTAKPSQEYIDKIHKQYVDALTALFHKYKGKYAGKDDTLTLV